MDHVITIIADPAVRAASSDVIDRAAREFSISPQRTWLAPDIACDLHLLSPDEEAANETTARVRAALRDDPVDVVLQPAAGRRKKLLIADMDSTIIEQETIDEIAGQIGIKAEIEAITARAMRGEIAFEPALEERVRLVKGVQRAALQQVLDKQLTLSPGARQLATTMAANGAVTALVSGGFTFFTEQIAARAGFARHFANVLEFDGDALSGAVAKPILGRAAKREALERLAGEAELTLEETLAVGDGANDIEMIEAAGMGVAYRAKPAAREAADAAITHGDLTALLYLQGYARTDFSG